MMRVILNGKNKMSNMNEIFDSFIEYSRKIIILDKYKSKLTQLKSVKAKRCGNCAYWMTSECIPEKKYKQFKHMNSHGCKLFTPGYSANLLINKFTEELAEIEKEAKL